MLQLKQQTMREVGSDSDAGSQPVYSMMDDVILDAILGQQLGSVHSMRSKKSHSSSSEQSDDTSIPKAVRTSMSMMHDQIIYWMNHSQMLEKKVTVMAGWLDIDASELAPHSRMIPPLHSHRDTYRARDRHLEEETRPTTLMIHSLQFF